MQMETTEVNSVATPAATTEDVSATSPNDHPSIFRTFFQRRSVWLIGALLVAAACAFVYHWAFGKPKILYSTAEVVRGDIESTVVAAGISMYWLLKRLCLQTNGPLWGLWVANLPRASCWSRRLEADGFKGTVCEFRR